MIIFEEFFKNPKREYKKLCDFLGIKYANVEFEVHNKTGKSINKWLQKIYLSIPSMRRYEIRDKLPERVTTVSKYVYAWFTKSIKEADKSPQLKEKIIYAFEDEIKEVGKLVNKDLLKLWS